MLIKGLVDQVFKNLLMKIITCMNLLHVGVNLVNKGLQLDSQHFLKPLLSSFSSSQDSQLRQRNVAPPPPPDRGEQRDGSQAGQDPPSTAPTKSLQQEAEPGREAGAPEPGTWSPLLTNVCLCSALAVSAYVCYRAYFH